MASESLPRIMVAGAGVTGLRISLNLAEMSHEVLLLDEAASPAGLVLPLEKQFPTNHCGLCRLLPQAHRGGATEGCLRRGLIHDNVVFMPRTRLTGVKGVPGRLTVTAEIQPPGIDPGLCTACGLCRTVCPVNSPDPFQSGMSGRPAVHPASPFSPAGRWVIDWTSCTRCGECARVCPTGAVNLSARVEQRIFEPVSMLVLATGRKLYDPASVDLYGAGRLPNVITATAFERLISPAGPFAGVSESGRPFRPSDRREAAKIAWVQCVGSRNLMIGADYCSNACCMFALKEAALVREASQGRVETAVFHMDLRTFGRDFQRYKDWAEKTIGVRLVRCRVHSLDQAEEPGRVLIRYTDPRGGPAAEEFDLVVLSTGQAPGQDRDRSDYASQPGVLAADSAHGLTDMSEALIGADAVTARAARLLDELGLQPNRTKVGVAPDKSKPAGGKPRVLAVFISPGDESQDWGRVDKNLPAEVALVRIKTKLDESALKLIRQTWLESGADRLIVYAPGPAAEVLTVSALARALDAPPALIEVVDYNFVLDRTVETGARAVALIRHIRLASRGLLARTPEAIEPVAFIPKVLVVGSGPAGLAAAAALDHAGLDVALVEKTGELAGTARRLRLERDRQAVAAMVDQVRKSPRLSVRLDHEVIRCQGMAGRYKVWLRDDSGRIEEIACGAVILAPGGGPAQVRVYGLGRHERIIAVTELHERLTRPDAGREKIEDVVLILCAGSREEPRNYCGRVCCPAALETGLEIKEINPQARVTVFYRDIMTYGLSERLYTEARRAGICFLPFEPSHPPQVLIEDDRPVVEGFDPLLQEKVRLTPDWLGLAVGVRPNDNSRLARVFKLDLTQDGFLKEAEVKWRPLDSGREGIFICGLGRAPARFEEARREGEGAAGRAIRLLARGAASGAPNTAYVQAGLCVGCLLCLPVCPYQARSINEAGGPILVDPAACQGCGLCVTACPTGAAELPDHDGIGLPEAVKTALRIRE
ncbi:MAG: 4Fe-4S binding protein [Thermodesulfobacteriota bacterium]